MSSGRWRVVFDLFFPRPLFPSLALSLPLLPEFPIWGDPDKKSSWRIIVVWRLVQEAHLQPLRGFNSGAPPVLETSRHSCSYVPDKHMMLDFGCFRDTLSSE